jgi:hypothetical protein
MWSARIACARGRPRPDLECAVLASFAIVGVEADGFFSVTAMTPFSRGFENQPIDADSGRNRETLESRKFALEIKSWNFWRIERRDLTVRRNLFACRPFFQWWHLDPAIGSRRRSRDSVHRHRARLDIQAARHDQQHFRMSFCGRTLSG